MSSWTFTPYNFPHLLPQATLCLFMAKDKIVEIRKLLIQFCRKVSKKKSEASALSDHGVTIILCWFRASVKTEMKRNCHMERLPGHWGWVWGLNGLQPGQTSNNILDKAQPGVGNHFFGYPRSRTPNISFQ